ncbi:MAG TPA: hypothetical protein VGR57_17905 [Ktedonobacterales bacterium]|nr:hypothetical protein [Ktedonobacterales bacterium]
MPIWAIITVQWLHVFCGIFWFGSRLVVSFILLPAMRRVKQAQQQAFVTELIRHFTRIEPALGVATILLGILRGTVFGAVQSLDVAFGTRYGMTWTVALTLGLVAAALGGMVGANFARLRAVPVAADGSSQAAYDAQLARTQAFSYASLAVFLVLFSCMILMRFGY